MRAEQNAPSPLLFHGAPGDRGFGGHKSGGGLVSGTLSCESLGQGHQGWVRAPAGSCGGDLCCWTG